MNLFQYIVEMAIPKYFEQLFFSLTRSVNFFNLSLRLHNYALRIPTCEQQTYFHLQGKWSLEILTIINDIYL